MGDLNYFGLGRLRAGVSVAAATAEIDALQHTISDHLAADEKATLSAAITPFQDQLVGKDRRPLIILLVAVAGLLLVGCVNVTNLLLARAVGQKQQMAVAAALGATRSELVRMALRETALLAAAGGSLGVLVAAGIVPALQRVPSRIPRFSRPSAFGLGRSGMCDSSGCRGDLAGRSGAGLHGLAYRPQRSSPHRVAPGERIAREPARSPRPGGRRSRGQPGSGPDDGFAHRQFDQADGRGSRIHDRANHHRHDRLALGVVPRHPTSRSVLQRRPGTYGSAARRRACRHHQHSAPDWRRLGRHGPRRWRHAARHTIAARKLPLGEPRILHDHPSAAHVGAVFQRQRLG